MTYPPTRRPATPRSTLDSPWLAALLVVAAIGIVAVLIGSGLLFPSGPGASGAPTSTIAGPTGSPTLPVSTFARPTPSPQPAFTMYTVQSGDTLNSIAKQFRTTARSIAWWNRGAFPSLDPESEAYNPDRLEVGWVLRVLPDTIVDENNPPPASPGPSSLPAVTPPPNPTSGPISTPGAAAATVVSHGVRTNHNIALTFDMGGRLDPAVDIVQWLIDHSVHATLFPTGKSGSQTAVGLAAMQLAATRPDLFDFANHSWDHPDFRDLTKAQMADQLTRTEAALAPIFGPTKPWFRPPFGGLNDAVKAGVGAAGWKYVVMWDLDMIDWRPEADGGPTAASMVAKLRANARGGSIVLMHLGGWHTLEALPGLLDAAGDLGLQPVTLGEMLGN